MNRQLYEFRSISYTIPPPKQGDSATLIIIDASFKILSGVLTVITGASGSGKTTLLRLFNRLSEPTSGEIIFDGKKIRDCPVKELRRRIGWVPQVPVRFTGTVEENLRLPFKYSNPSKYSSREISMAVDELKALELLPSELFSRKADDLSIGEAQRMNLLRAIALKPDILLLDEPTSALDPKASDALLGHIKRIQAERDLTSIMVTHHPDEELLGQFSLCIVDGIVRMEGSRDGGEI